LEGISTIASRESRSMVEAGMRLWVPLHISCSARGPEVLVLSWRVNPVKVA
jgi:hypothetical protein